MPRTARVPEEYILVKNPAWEKYVVNYALNQCRDIHRPTATEPCRRHVMWAEGQVHERNGNGN